jgi:flagellar hook-associated protein 1 FlgK
LRAGGAAGTLPAASRSGHSGIPYGETKGFDALLIGKTALIAANYGLQVTGQNLSNANTTGYSRQVLRQTGAANAAGRGTSVLLGGGVAVKGVTRIASAQAEKQLRQATSSDAYYGSLETCYSQMQAYFNELTGNALSDAMTGFWNSLGNLSAHVETLANRSTAIEDALTLTTQLNDLSTQLKDYRRTMNAEVEESVGQINAIVKSIASLNRSITVTECGGLAASTANDLRDERGELLRQLSEYLDIDVTEEANGSCIVSAAGRSLVYYDQVYELAVGYEKSGDMLVAVPEFARDGYPIKVSAGKLAAQLEIRDVIVSGYVDDLDQLAASFTWEFNRIYSQGRGDDSFGTLTSINSPVDPAVRLDQLQYKAAIPDGTFTIVNGNLQVIVHNRETGQETTVPLEIDLDGRLDPSGEPDMILWDPANPEAANSFVNRLQTALDEAIPGAFTVKIDNEYKVTIAGNSDSYGFCFGEDTSGILAALGLNVFFTGHDAQTIGVNRQVIDNPSLMAVSTSFASGDNQGVLNLIAFGETALGRLGDKTPDEFYQNLTGRLASEASRTSTMREVKGDLLTRMFNQREEISGVNEDEETVKLLAYQRAYQSAAKYLSVVDELYETLIDL